MIPSSSPQESQGLQWKVEGAKVSVSGDDNAIAKFSNQLKTLGITPSSSASKTITISKEDFSKLQASDSSLSIPDDTRSQLVAAVQTAQAKEKVYTAEELIALVKDTSRLKECISSGGVNIIGGDRLFRVAALFHKPEAILELVAAGVKTPEVKIDQKDINDALLAAVQRSDAKTVVGLCELGATPKNVWDWNGVPLLYLAAKRGDSEMIKTLIAHGATVQKSLEMIASLGTVSALDAFVRAGVRPDAKSYPDGLDLLTTASTYNPGMVDPLLSTGWVNLEALLVNSVAAEYGGLRPAVPSSVVLAKRPDMETAIKIVEKKDLPRDKIDQIVSKIRQLYA